MEHCVRPFAFNFVTPGEMSIEHPYTGSVHTQFKKYSLTSVLKFVK